MSYRHFDQHILSLLHFDYPYYAEPHDGLNDEILGTAWARNGNVKLAGSEIPADVIINGTPKFGYRCLYSQSSNDYISAASDIFSLNSDSHYELSCYVRPAASQSGNIFALFDDSTQVFTLTLNNDLSLSLNCPQWNLSLTSSQTLSLNTWYSIALRISPSQCSIIIDNFSISADITRTQLQTSSCRLGGFNGFIDEFVFRDNFSSAIPSQPVQASISITELGGFGAGTLGNVTIPSDCSINSYAACSISNDKTALTLSNISQGLFGAFDSGNEIMILNNETGIYDFREIHSITGNSLRLTSPSSLSGNSLQVISVPHFMNLTIPQNITISPAAFSNNRGGVVIFRVKNNCTINGKILTQGKGRIRTDNMQLTHAKLIDNFLLTTGGNTMIFCGGTFTASSTARIGASWSGEGEAGTPALNAYGGNGGAGYGGAGGSANSLGGYGGVGGGGGGAKNSPAGNAGTGGTGGKSGTGKSGGTQGITSGGNSQGADDSLDTGGGGAGGHAGAAYNSSRADIFAGANVVIITKILKADSSAVSTGGQGGGEMDIYGIPGGGGTGFCYIACEEMK